MTLHLADSLEGIGPCDCIITDPPYSKRTHTGHDASAQGHLGPGFDKAQRDPITYSFWDSPTVGAAAAAWNRACSGWIVILTDHVLAPHWAESFDARGRYVFAPLPAVINGAGVRLSGDGPSSWTRWIVVARPRCEPYSKWGTLPGAYVGKREEMPWIGGKPLWLMRALVRDYSRPGDLVCDPCCGGGTTLVAAKDLGRRFVGYDIDPKAIEMTKKRLAQEVLPLGGV